MRRPLLFAVLGLGLLPRPAAAQTPPPKPPPPQSLASALRSLPPDALGQSALLLTVAPQSVYTADLMAREMGRPAPAADPSGPTPDDRTLAGVADRYGRIVRRFGAVTALAPATMVVLAAPDAFALSAGHVPMKQALKILLGSLSPAQMRRLGTTGLGAEDLSDEQRAFFQAALPRALQVVPTSLPSPQFSPKDPTAFGKARAAYSEQVRTLPADVFGGGTRLHANLLAQYTFNIPKGNMGFFAWRDDSRTPDPVPLKLSATRLFPEDTPDSALRAEVPNTPKGGDLRLDAAAFDAPIPLDGLRTADDLVTRIAQVTHTELYCDPHYAPLPLLFLGDTSRPVPAADLLGALDLGLAATWRRVGPAFVLTDDVLGVGTRRRIINNVVSAWNARLKAMIADSARALAAGRWWEQLPFAPDDPGALPPDLVQTLTGDPKSYRWGGDVPFGRLPAALQADLRARLQNASAREGDQDTTYQDMTETTRDGQPFTVFGAEHTIPMRDAYAQIDAALASDPQFKVGVELQCRFFLDAPGVGAVALDNGYDLFQVPFTRREPDAPGTPAPAGPARAALAAKRRGVLCAPRTPAEARAVVARMAALGLNTLLCAVFCDGRAAFPNTAFPPTADAAGMLGAAVAEGKARGVRVYAVLDTLRWRRGGSAPLPRDAAEDLTVTGETAAEALSHLPADPNRPAEDRELDDARLAGGWVSPADPVVGPALAALVDQVARTPGLAGLAFRDTLAPGYLGRPGFDYLSPTQLGYGPALRLAFLRARHADPVDVSDGSDSRLQVGADGEMDSFENAVDLSLPAFEGDGSGIDAQWQAFRAGSDRVLLARLYAAARAAAPALPLWMQERAVGLSFEPWSDPKALPEQKSPQAPQAQRVGPTGLILIPGTPSSAHPGLLPMMIEETQKEFLAGKPDAGLILDLGPGSPLPTLDALGTMIQMPSKLGGQP